MRKPLNNCCTFPVFIEIDECSSSAILPFVPTLNINDLDGLTY